jgi:dehydrogenase/reductase SDR family member 7B
LTDKSGIKVAWITGASSGIGEALAIELSQCGYHLILSGRDVAELTRVMHLCNSPLNCIVLPFDLSDSNHFDGVIENAISFRNRIDLLINSGGISQRAAVMDTSTEVLRKLMEVNFFSHAILSKKLLPLFRKQGGGKIVIMSSLAGKFGFFLRSSYSASKHALHGFFEALRLEEAQNNISVLIVCPGYIKTSISMNALDGKGNKHAQLDLNQERGMLPQHLAVIIRKAIDSNKKEIIVGGREVIPAYLKRFFPALFYWIIARIDPRNTSGTRP